MSKKTVCLGLSIILVLFLLAACSNDKSASPGNSGSSQPSGTSSGSDGSVVELKMWQQWGNGHEKEVLDQMIKKFEDSHPNIKITETAVTDNAKILTAISGGTAPDIIDLGSTNALGEWAAKGALTPLDDLLEQDNIDKNQFIPASWKAVTYKGKVYAMPFVAFNEGLLYNKQMFKDAGLDPEKPPKTMEELTQYAEKLTKTDASGKITQMGFVPNWPGSHLQTSLAWLFGGEFYNENDKKITVNDPGIVKALEWERQFYQKYGPQKVQDFITSSGQYLTAQDLFESGKLAMTIDGSWAIRFIQENVKDLDQQIGAAYIPSSSEHPDLYGTSFIDVNPQIIPAGAKHPKEAWQFIKWLTTDKDIASEFADLVANIPHLKDAPTTKLLDDPRFKVFIELAGSDKARIFPKLSNSNEYATKLADVENQVMLDPKADIQKLLDSLNDELNGSLQN
jgi:multiple sugar transport system substrate-binding protein